MKMGSLSIALGVDGESIGIGIIPPELEGLGIIIGLCWPSPTLMLVVVVEEELGITSTTDSLVRFDTVEL